MVCPLSYHKCHCQFVPLGHRTALVPIKVVVPLSVVILQTSPESIPLFLGKQTQNKTTLDFQPRGLRDVSVGRNTCYSFRVPEFGSQTPYRCLQLPMSVQFQDI